MLDRAAQLALAAAREAMAMARPAFAPRRAGAVLGAAIGQETFDDAYRSFYGEGINRVPPFDRPARDAERPGQRSFHGVGLRGPSFSTASACASATHAIGQAFHMVRSGMLDLAVTGGGDASVVVGVLKGWEALRVLSADACRPFSARPQRPRDRRRGGDPGAGTARRGPRAWAEVLAEIVGFGMSADAGDLTAPNEEGAAAAIRAALEDGGLEPSEIGYVNAHGTGTRLNDRTEAAALRLVFGAHPPPASSSKSMMGHCMSAGGALEAVLTVQALRDRVLPPTIGFREADPECDLDVVPNAARPVRARAALSNSFAFGGLNAVLAFREAA